MHTPDTLPSIKVKDLIRESIVGSATLQFIDFHELMVPNPQFTYFEIMSVLIRKAVEEFEGRFPLLKRSLIHLTGDEYMFEDTFDAFLDGIVREEFTTLIPKTSPHSVETSMFFGGRRWRYERPYLRELYQKGRVVMDYQAPYPVRLYKETDKDEFTDDSRIYYMSLNGGSSKDRQFKLQFLVILLGHLRSIKNNIRYPDMPMELMQDIDQEYSYKQQELLEYYRKNPYNGGLSR